MTKRVKTGGGSRKGVPNKSTLEVKELLDANVDFSVLITKLFQLATQKGDSTAAKILMEYRFGKPHQSTDITTNGKSLIPPQIILKA